MIDVTDVHFRKFMSLFSRRSQLWTEMVVENAVRYNLHGPTVRDAIALADIENPSVCQLGGSDPAALADAASMVVREWGYREINLNVGCPSDRVAGQGCFGAALMKEPELVRDIVSTISRQVGPEVTVTVKTRLGVDEFESYDFAKGFVQTVSEGGCRHFIIHARKAWLSGLDPHQNRTIPPLHYDRVYRLARDFPHIDFTLNGGITSLDMAEDALHGRWRSATPPPDEEEMLMQELHKMRGPRPLRGVMMGRAPLNNPCVMADVDRRFYGELNPPTTKSRRVLLEAYLDWVDREYPECLGVYGLHWRVIKPIIGIFAGQSGHRTFRYHIDVISRGESDRLSASEIIRKAMDIVDDHSPHVLDQPIVDPGAPALPLPLRPTNGKNRAAQADEWEIDEVAAILAKGPMKIRRNAPDFLSKASQKKREHERRKMFREGKLSGLAETETMQESTVCECVWEIEGERDFNGESEVRTVGCQFGRPMSGVDGCGVPGDELDSPASSSSGCGTDTGSGSTRTKAGGTEGEEF
ncbi:unnamed protein product [Vitrella brassicaformis CCMP3155]|uniref:DUS-like FMN-binding domain-containing protein n=1 Tax=Vitrella brassicaformis (strain CCMP3155) TaxID=1169540 RepID=A0A0G4FEQ8_VITBC|nr:unnamed protein product [Vitrella brassicaformis CCMP3155]|eukprot:CEM11292.1 unnamed protein product [Vitrella brassicaformis CCMP3155]